ncbi:MAG: hypothetical protein JJU05_06755 [Verrucomicrobia bacterium]|nr:hypothetical protein [Verrucomicrobiota bacterium]MCH8527053.1 hypothetical protein [Kiritimatiellia bacterium]
MKKFSRVPAGLFSLLSLSLARVPAEIPPAGVPWTLPDVATALHPGAETAPASSPVTYPDSDGFAARRRIVLEGVADNNLNSWRRGYFTGGDPGKYLPGHAMAKLLLGQNDPDIVRLYNDNRSVREHYHFAAMNWGRFLPIFGPHILTPEKQAELAERAAGYTAYHSGGGTENHVTQWRTQLPVLPHYLEGNGSIGRRSKEDVLNTGKEWLRTYVRGIYQGGNGEWDSSTYLIFTMNGLLNIYDFAKDEEVRLIAKAGLDWFTTAYALKYRDGLFTAPLQRGFVDSPHGSETDQTGYLWFGSNADLTPADTRGFRYTVHAASSAYRPNETLVNLARKDLPGLPVTFHNTKPNYWGTTGSPRPSVHHETFYISQTFSLGSLWNGQGSQLSRMGLVVDSPEGGVGFSGGHPRSSDHNGNKTGIGFASGTSRYTQTMQADNTLISLSLSPEDEEHDYAYFRIPNDSTLEPVTAGGHTWWTRRIENTLVAVLPISEGEPEITTHGEGRRMATFLKIPGRKAGFVLHVLENIEADGIADALADARLDTSALETDLALKFQTPAGQSLMMRFIPAEEGDRHAARAPHAEIDGEAVTFGQRPVYDGPFVHQADGVLSVNDGRQGFVIDFTGDLPVYKEWSN